MAQVARHAFLQLRPPPLHLRAREVLVTVVDGLELTTVDGDARRRQKAHLPARLDKARADLAQRIPVVLAEVGNRLVVDRRLKSNIRQLPSSLEAMLRLKPVSFSMNDNLGRTEYGLIAQDVEGVFPALVYTAADPSATKSLNYIGLIAPTIKALQELRADNDNLRSEVEDLRRELRDLKNGVGFRRTRTS